MSRFNLNPSKEDLAKYGPLAYVSPEERQQIMYAPFGHFKTTIKALEKEIKLAKKVAAQTVKISGVRA